MQITSLDVRYGRAVHALDDVTLSVVDRSVTVVLGGNGAGKSTLLRAISGTLPLHRGRIVSGTIDFEGRRVNRLPPADLVAAGVVQVPEGRQVFATMTVEENLRAGAMTLPRERRAQARDHVLDLFPQLAERRTQRAALLSGGEQQMLAIARALMSEPKLLLLDEPSLGLAPKLVSQIATIVTEINARGTTVLLVEQNAAMGLQLADSAVVLEVGRVARSGPAAELGDSEDLAALYLGGSAESGTSVRERLAEVAGSRATTRPTLSRWER